MAVPAIINATSIGQSLRSWKSAVQFFPADDKALNSMANAICFDLLMALINIGRIDIFRYNNQNR